MPYGGDEELRSVGVGSSVGHGQETRSGVLQLEVLVVELLSVDGLTSSSVSGSEISSLDHEVGNNAVEDRTLVVKRLSGLADSLLTSAQSAEVLHGLGHSLSEPTIKLLKHTPTVP